MKKNDIKNYSVKELRVLLDSLCKSPYRADQISYWLYKKGVSDFAEMKNVPSKIIDKLNKDFTIGRLEISENLKSVSGTEKYLFKLDDGNYVETVLIPAAKRKTICISTQVGCGYNCSFCASGKMGFVRNLSVSEIINQILVLQHEFSHKITNYVFMGMGEPLDNYDNVEKAILLINDKKGMDIGARRITVSTCGIIPGIVKMMSLGLQVNLSISLHAAGNKLRNELIPVNKIYPVEELIDACEQYVKKTGRMITLEYVVLKGMNDSAEDAEGLFKIAKRLRAKINLIPCSTIKESDRQPEKKTDIDMFMNRLIEKGANVTLRDSKGTDIHAACGQLAGKAGRK